MYEKEDGIRKLEFESVRRAKEIKEIESYRPGVEANRKGESRVIACFKQKRT
jgi:hypothetical protein